jgi:hypothetical protein
MNPKGIFNEYLTLKRNSVRWASYLRGGGGPDKWKALRVNRVPKSFFGENNIVGKGIQNRLVKSKN